MLTKHFPNVGTEILIGDDIFVTQTNPYEEEHLSYGDIDPVRCTFADLPKSGWIKTVFIDTPANINEMIAFAEQNPCEHVHCVSSAPMFFEVLPQGVNKGSGLKKLVELAKLEGYRIVAAGDYMNDIEMLQAADLSFAVANAEDAVKAVADVVVRAHDCGAMREIVDYLENI
jgi:hypothetical protein